MRAPEPAAAAPPDGAGRWSGGATERLGACPLCGAPGTLGPALETVRAGGGPRAERWRMKRCAGCRSLYLDPRPDEASLPRAYEHYYTHTAQEAPVPRTGAAALVWSLVHGYLNHRFGLRRTPGRAAGRWLFALLPPLGLKLDYYGRHLYAGRFPRGGRLLDVGCGNGLFVARAREMGWRAEGLEPDPRAAAACRERGERVIEGDLRHCPAEWREAFDVITLSHCIEHMREPAADLGRLAGLLRPGGWLWLALPNPGSPGARLFGGAWRGLHAPFHLAIPSQRQLRRMLESAGFERIQPLRRGAHAAMIWRESLSALASGPDAGHGPLQQRLLAAARPLVDLAATLSPAWGEETVMLARRPP